MPESMSSQGTDFLFALLDPNPGKCPLATEAQEMKLFSRGGRPVYDILLLQFASSNLAVAQIVAQL
jgi:hypothetical protein